MDGTQLSYVWTLFLLPTGIQPLKEAVQRQGAQSGDKRKKAAYSRESMLLLEFWKRL